MSRCRPAVVGEAQNEPPARAQADIGAGAYRCVVGDAQGTGGVLIRGGGHSTATEGRVVGDDRVGKGYGAIRKVDGAIDDGERRGAYEQAGGQDQGFQTLADETRSFHDDTPVSVGCCTQAR